MSGGFQDPAVCRLEARIDRQGRIIDALIDVLYELETEHDGGLLQRKHVMKIEDARKG